MRGNSVIDYKQLGLLLKLYQTEASELLLVRLQNSMNFPKKNKGKNDEKWHFSKRSEAARKGFQFGQFLFQLAFFSLAAVLHILIWVSYFRLEQNNHEMSLSLYVSLDYSELHLEVLTALEIIWVVLIVLTKVLSILLLNICKACIYKFAMFNCIPLDLELLVAQTSYSVECHTLRTNCKLLSNIFALKNCNCYDVMNIHVD